MHCVASVQYATPCVPVSYFARLNKIKAKKTMVRKKNDYSDTLRAFLGYLDGCTYQRDHVFTEERLSRIVPEEIVRFFNSKAYGCPHPTQNDRPTKGRSSALYYYKKAISQCLPNKHIPWNDLARTGNPTRSIAVNEMIKRVIKFETRGQGAPSKARRPLREAEFRELLARCREFNDDIYSKYMVPALLCFQFHMIGRVDDCCQWQRQNFSINPVHPHKSAQGRLAWSKNVNEEQNAPWQHLFGSMDWVFCVLLSVGIWLEVFLGNVFGAAQRVHVFGFSDDPEPETAGNKTKDKVYRVLSKILGLMGVEAVLTDDGPVGSHSVRKLSSTYVRSNGVTKDDKEYRGRWKRKRVSDDYDDIQLDSVDANVAKVLCIGGVCHYKVVDPACTDAFITGNVTPNIALVYGEELAILLGRAILWFCYTENADYLPAAMLERIRSAYEDQRTLPDGQNPVKKVEQVVSGHNAQVFMESMGEDEASDMQGTATNDNNNAQGHTARRNIYQQQNGAILHAILAQGQQQQQAINGLNERIDGMTSQLRSHSTILTRVANRIDSNPVNMLRRAANRQQQQAQAGTVSPEDRQASVHSTATLAPNVRSIEMLWHEWMHGIGSRKAAKDFTPVERGKCKSKFCRRKIVWDLMCKHLRAGRLATDVIADIYASYPTLSVTGIINAMRKDRDNNTLPVRLRL